MTLRLYSRLCPLNTSETGNPDLHDWACMLWIPKFGGAAAMHYLAGFKSGFVSHAVHGHPYTVPVVYRFSQ
jgi:hypothetical protein